MKFHHYKIKSTGNRQNPRNIRREVLRAWDNGGNISYGIVHYICLTGEGLREAKAYCKSLIPLYEARQEVFHVHNLQSI